MIDIEKYAGKDSHYECCFVGNYAFVYKRVLSKTQFVHRPFIESRIARGVRTGINAEDIYSAIVGELSGDKLHTYEFELLRV